MSVFDSLNISIVLMPDTIVSIGNNAFANNNIYYIEFSDNLKTIGDYAFYKNNISFLNLNENIERIGNFAFAFNELTSVDIPNDTDIELGFACFNQNKMKEENAYIYNSYNGNDKYELLSYGGTKSNIVVPEGTVKISNYAFSGMDVGDFGYSKINSVVLPSTLKIIGRGAFENNNLSSVDIPESVMYIGKSAFNNNNISKLNIQNAENMYLGVKCFNNNKLDDNMAYIVTTKAIPDYVYDVNFDGYSLVSSVVKGQDMDSNVNENQTAFFEEDIENVRTLVSYAGKNRNKLLIPYSIITIADESLSDLSIKEISIPTSIENIGNKAFSNNNLSSVTIPDSVKKVGYNAFASNNISDITILGKTSLPEEFDISIEECTNNLIFK